MNKQNNKTKRNIKTMKCAPKTKKKGYTCYTDKSLNKLKKFWNMRHPDEKITTNDSYEIWKNLKAGLNNVCNTEACWLKQKFISSNLDKDLLNYTFAPNAPNSWKKNKNTWLSSIDIEKVMKQYENAYKNFAFIGPSPIDFDTPKIYNTCVWEELCKFNLSDFIKKNKTKIGIIFNTDPHYKGGQHWVCLMIDIPEKIIYYFDSVGDKPQEEIIKLVEKIKQQGKELNIDFIYKENHPFEHQEGTTECGVYVMYFLTKILEKKHNYDYFTTNKIHDQEMEKYRKIFFN